MVMIQQTIEFRLFVDVITLLPAKNEYDKSDNQNIFLLSNNLICDFKSVKIYSKFTINS